MGAHRDQVSPAFARHRDQLFSQLSGQIMREATDHLALERTGHRILNMAEVRGDPELERMLRGCIAEREVEIRGRQARFLAEEVSSARPAAVPSFRSVTPPDPLQEKVHAAQVYQQCIRSFEDRLHLFDVPAAQRVLDQLEQLAARHPDVIPRPALERCRVDIARVQMKKEQFAAEVEQLGHQAVHAASTGQIDVAARALRRLSSIHATKPSLVSDALLDSIHEQIARAGESAEFREAARALVERQKNVMNELNQLASIIHEFHRVTHEIPHGAAEYADAERRYFDAVRAVRKHDKDWYADLIVETGDLLAELHDPTGRAGQQVERFLDTVRTSIREMVAEIRQIAAESKK